MPDFDTFNDRLGDIEFIRSKILLGDVFRVSGDIDALNDTIEFIPANGKTAFLISAKIVSIDTLTPVNAPSSGSTSKTDSVRAALKINDIIEDTTRIGFASSGVGTGTTNQAPAQSAYGNLGDGRFDAFGLSLVGDGVKSIEIENVLDNGNAFATMFGWIEDT